MKAVLSVVIVLFCCCVPSLLAAQNSSPDPEEVRILALEAAWNHAEQQKDTGALNLLLANSMSYMDYDGTLMDKAQFLESARKSSLHPVQIMDEEIKAHIYGQSAVVTGLYTEIGTDKAKPYRRRGRFTDMWIKLGDSWQCVSSQSTLIAR
jgi:ketosteroid isomerase-like protein